MESKTFQTPHLSTGSGYLKDDTPQSPGLLRLPWVSPQTRTYRNAIAQNSPYQPPQNSGIDEPQPVTTLLLSTFLIVLFAAAQTLANRQRIASLERRLNELRELTNTSYPPQLSLPDLSKPALEGLRIAIQIDQDHDRPIFAYLLRDRLIAEDALPTIVDPSKTDSPPSDIQVRGKLLCNGYEELFFDATIDCLTPDGHLLTLVEKPPTGGRQLNLSNTLVTRLKTELQASTARHSRHQALKELQS